MNWLHRWRIVLVALGAVLLFTGAALGSAGWYYSDALKREALVPDRSPEELDLIVTDVSPVRVTLEATSDADDDGDWTKSGTFGLEWKGGYGQVGTIMALDKAHVVREFTPMLGSPQPGVRTRLDSFAFPGDPEIAFGMPFEEVTFDSPLGSLAAWFVKGSSDTWAVFVHGKGADRREALRMLPVFRAQGIPSLVITYRNDEGAPAGEDGLYEYGQTEWEDLQSATGYALTHGAERLVLVGYSMGGGIVMRFLHTSPLAEAVVGIILDSPVLDFDETVDWGARDRFVPWPVKDIGKRIAAWRFDIDWDGLDYAEAAQNISVPILLFHGDEDPKVPVTTSDRLADARPDLVTYHRTPGAGHVRSWNADPAAYEAAAREFLGRVEPIPSTAGDQ